MPAAPNRDPLALLQGRETLPAERPDLISRSGAVRRRREDAKTRRRIHNLWPFDVIDFSGGKPASRLRPKTAFSRFPSVLKDYPERVLRVDTVRLAADEGNAPARPNGKDRKRFSLPQALD
jgi:hypothetical protein